MNLCFLSGKIVNEIDLEFIFDINRKSLNKKHTSIVKIVLELENKQIVYLQAYDDMADFVYRNIKHGDYVFVYGYLKKCEVIINEFRKL